MEVSLLHLLRRASQKADDLFTTLGETELTPRQFVVLSAVAEFNGLCQTEIVQMTGIDRSTTADMVRRMVSQGLLVRQRRMSDARAYSVEITDLGREKISRSSAAAQLVDTYILHELPQDKREHFIASLQKLAISDAKELKLGQRHG